MLKIPMFGCAMALTVTLAVTLATVPAGAAPPDPTSADQRTNSGLGAAWAKAAKAGAPVEVPDRFTETMKVWAEPDGKHLRAQLHTRPIQLRNPDSGVWEPIDTSIVARDGELRTVRTKTPLTFGGRGSKQLVSAAGPQGTAGLKVRRALPEPKISGSTITYPDAVAAGADLVVQSQADGFVSRVVIRRKPTGPVTVRLPLTLPKGATFGKTSGGLPQLKDAKGRAKAAPVVLTAVDAKAEASAEAGRSAPVTTRVETSGAKSELVFTPDPKFLADPAVTYPVTIAAASEWFGGGVPDDAWVSKNDPYNNHAADGWLRAGTTQTSADIARVYLKFNTAAPELKGATVVKADLIMWNYKSGGPNGALCGDPLGAGIVAARVSSSWSSSGLSWYNQPSTAGSTEGLNRAGYNYDATGTWCAKDEQLWHRVTGMARAWIEQDVPNHGLVLRAASETAAINWRQYYASEYSGNPYPGYRHPPTLMVEYTPPPTETQWVKFEADELTEFPTYQQAKALAAEPLDDAANWSLTTQEADAIEQLGQGVANEITSDQLQPSPSDVEVDPATMDPDEAPAGSLPSDETPPTVVEVRPAADSVDVPVGATVTVTFSEPVWEPQVTIKDIAGAAVPGTTAMDATNTVATFAPTQPLKSGTVQSAEVSEAYDADGNEMVPHSWRFTTENDTTPPVVSANTPAAQATNVPVTTPVTVTFSEPVTDARFTLKGPADAVVAGTSAMDATQRVLTFTPAVPLADTTAYTAEVSGAKDAADNTMVAAHTWSFTTGVRPPTGLVAAYGMNEGAGTGVADSSGQHNTGTAAGTTWATNGRYGKALSFNGTSSRVTVADAPSLRLSRTLTMSAWVRPSTVTSWRTVVGKGLTQGQGASYMLYAANGTAPSGWLESGGQSYQVNGSTPLPTNAWSHLAVTYDGSTARLYVNGTRVAQTSLTGALDVDGGAVTIGGNEVWGEYFSGLIDEVRIYNRALDAASIQADMNTPVGASDPTPTPTPTPTPSPTPTGPPTQVPGLVAAYGMNEGAGTTVSDSSGRNNAGAAADTTWATNGKYGKALSFNGSSSLVDVSHTSSLRLTGALTLSAWVKPDDLDGWRTVVLKNMASGYGASYGLYASEGSVPAGWLTTTGDPFGPSGSSPLPTGTWSNVALTYDGSRATLYVNGAKAGEVAATGSIYDDGGAVTIGGNEIWGEYFSGLIDEVRIYNRALTAAQIQSDMNTPIGAAPAGTAQVAPQTAATSTGPEIAKLATATGKGTTPTFTTWVTDPQERPATVQVQVAPQPTKSPKAKWAAGKELTWSGTVTGKRDGLHALRMPSGKLKQGQWMRWRARPTVAGATGEWSGWQTFRVGDEQSVGKLPAPTTVAASDPNTGTPFDYQRMSRTDCNNARRSSPRPYHGFGWTVLHPYSACYSRILGWGDWEVDLITGLPTSRCPKSQGVMMTANVIVYTNLGTKNGSPVVGGESTPKLTARDISLWTSITEIQTVGPNCTPTNAFDGDTIQLRVGAQGSDNSNCTKSEGRDRTATIGDFKRNGEDAFVFRSEGTVWGNCTLRPKLYPGKSFLFLDPTPFRLWQYLTTEQGAPTRAGDLPFVARCDSRRISYPIVRSNGTFGWAGNTGGCRFLGADRVYTMYTGDPHRGEVARHIQSAFRNPQDTDPKVDKQGRPIAKNFPGNYDACVGAPPGSRCKKAPLTRRVNSERAPDGVLFNSKNRNLRDKYCKDLPGRDDPNKQCDEYPFRSTFQAIGVDGKLDNDVWVPSLNASLHMVSTAHNQAAGRDLGAFYARYRVFTSGTPEGGLSNLPANAFFVRIKDGTP
ncbi:LamG-like jellyroll fold domain-containing protein [Micromonospora sp. FIMYZ51]|uniref:LamG-like jellyroll fold domain-containing protein n=1 Tax=Micromonospora sp. FIMYZ51 TaxID=3051832 RepID=UPI00311DB07A